LNGVLAAVDCGTNSTRLLIVDEEGHTVRREMRITRLGEGVDRTGRLAPTALERTFNVLDEYAGMMRHASVTAARLVATSAARDAENGEEFLTQAATRTGAEVVILDGDEEATLSYRGATSGLEAIDVPTAICDIGGGSTELAAFVGGGLVTHSMQVGCVRVAERALGTGLVTPASADAARAMISEALDTAVIAAPGLARLVGAVRLVGLAGTVSTLAQLVVGQPEYSWAAVHHRVLTRADVIAWRDRLGEELPAARLEHPGMVKGREDVMPAGLYILDVVMERLRVEELLSSESDILDGIVASMRDS
jgi:exopolyphosphatase/guanosine-5'-triphosphate,3'-diphosphate pyrophosphatase